MSTISSGRPPSGGGDRGNGVSRSAADQEPYATKAINCLTSIIRRSQVTTVMGLEVELREGAEALKKANPRVVISLSAGFELFMRSLAKVTAATKQQQHGSSAEVDLERIKRGLIESGEKFAEESTKARRRIAELGERFVSDGAMVMLHGYSRCVMQLLGAAAAAGKHFRCVVCEGCPDDSGRRVADALRGEHGIPCEVIVDSAAAFVMERVDLVLLGAEGVVESGGIFNKVGTYQVATVAKALGKPVYVAAESYKFVRLYPLNQRDVPDATETLRRISGEEEAAAALESGPAAGEARQAQQGVRGAGKGTPPAAPHGGGRSSGEEEGGSLSAAFAAASAASASAFGLHSPGKGDFPQPRHSGLQHRSEATTTTGLDTGTSHGTPLQSRSIVSPHVLPLLGAGPPAAELGRSCGGPPYPETRSARLVIDAAAGTIVETSGLKREKAAAGTSVSHLAPLAPLRDYTPPDAITLLFTDLGILTPAAVSDELIQLYL